MTSWSCTHFIHMENLIDKLIWFLPTMYSQGLSLIGICTNLHKHFFSQENKNAGQKALMHKNLTRICLCMLTTIYQLECFFFKKPIAWIIPLCIYCAVSSTKLWPQKSHYYQCLITAISIHQLHLKEQNKFSYSMYCFLLLILICFVYSQTSY